MYDRVLWEWLDWCDTLEEAKAYCDGFLDTEVIGTDHHWLIFKNQTRGYGVWEQVMDEERLNSWKPNDALVAYRNYATKEWTDK